MKILLFIFASSAALAAPPHKPSPDPFDPASCSGPTISTQRALQLLGPNPSVNLVTKKPWDKNGGIFWGNYRVRQTLNGVTSGWYASDNYDFALEPVLLNDSGKLSVVADFFVHIYPNDSLFELGDWNCPAVNADATQVTCSLQHGGPGVWYDDQPKVDLATTFDFKLTDHCVWRRDDQKDQSSEREWVYLLNF